MRILPAVFAATVIAALVSTICSAQFPAEFDDAEAEVYKKVGDVELKMYLFKPAGHKPTDRRPAIVFFFGGGWRGGTPTQFQQQSKYLASRGMVAMAADYRVLSRHQTKQMKRNLIYSGRKVGTRM